MGSKRTRDGVWWEETDPTSQTISEVTNQLPPRRQVDQGEADAATASPANEGSVMLLDSWEPIQSS